MPLGSMALEPAGSRRVGSINRRLLGTSRACSVAYNNTPFGLLIGSGTLIR